MHYFEARHIVNKSEANMATDIMKHLQARQYLGRAMVVCDKPAVLMGTSHKCWYKLARLLQSERAGTLDSEKILRLTKAITHMHRVQFEATQPEQQPQAHVYFLTAEELANCIIPVNTYSFYVMTPANTEILGRVVGQLPHDALVVQYNLSSGLETTQNLLPKQQLEVAANASWQSVVAFLAENGIDIKPLVHRNTLQGSQAVDDALDALLGVSHRFLQLAGDFQREFELAQPFSFAGDAKLQYETFMLLARRVQSLSPAHPLTQTQLDIIAQNETFFLHDGATDQVPFVQQLASAVEYHTQAGRTRLARALVFAAHS